MGPAGRSCSTLLLHGEKSEEERIDHRSLLFPTSLSMSDGRHVGGRGEEVTENSPFGASPLIPQVFGCQPITPSQGPHLSPPYSNSNADRTLSHFVTDTMGVLGM